MLIIDGDYPMAFGAVSMERDLPLPIEQTRRDPILPHRPSDWDTHRDGIMASIPEIRSAEMTVALVKIGDTCILRPRHDHGTVKTDHHSYANGRAHLGYYQILEATGHISLLKTSTEFKTHMSMWENATNYSELPVGVVEVMADRGYNTDDIQNVMWRNWQRFFEENLPG